MDKILFIDTLTTGMQPGRCGLYGLGGIMAERTIEGTKELQRFEFRMRPNDNIRIIESSLWTGGITRRDLLAYEREDKVLKSFCSLLDGFVKMSDPNDKAYLAGFGSSSIDLPFIRDWFERNGNRHFRDYFHVQTLDIACLSAYALVDKRKEMQDFHLETVARMFNVNMKKGESYSCLENAEACINIFRTLNEILKTGEKGTNEITDKTIKNF